MGVLLEISNGVTVGTELSVSMGIDVGLRLFGKADGVVVGTALSMPVGINDGRSLLTFTGAVLGM